MLKFIQESDFLKVDTFKENEDGSVSWAWDEGEGLPTHSGVIRKGFKRFTQDGDGNEVEIDVWAKLHQLQSDGAINIIYPTQEELDEKAQQAQINAFKSERQKLLDNAVVTTESGLHFDADEKSISRMANAIISAQDAGVEDLPWSMADTGTGVMTTVTLGELKEAHKLAVQNMANIWGVE